MVIEFKQTAPSKLYWAGRPAMRIVQTAHEERGQIYVPAVNWLLAIATLVAVVVFEAWRQQGFGDAAT